MIRQAPETRDWMHAGLRLVAVCGDSGITLADKFMPTYEYACSRCKKTFEMFQSMKDDALKTCPESHCQMKRWGKGDVKRLLGAGAGLIFKGSGFYITDYRSEGYKQAAKKDSSSSTPAASEKKPDSKPKESKPAADKKPKKSSD